LGDPGETVLHLQETHRNGASSHRHSDRLQFNFFVHFFPLFTDFRFGFVGLAPGLGIAAVGFTRSSSEIAVSVSSGMWMLSAVRGTLISPLQSSL
jgi:hypothetical protein